MNKPSLAVFARDTIVATSTIVGLYVVAGRVPLQPLQIPGYLLIVGFDILEILFGPVRDNYTLFFGGYLVGVGVLAATAGRLLRRRTEVLTRESWWIGIAGAFTIIGLLAAIFAIALIIGTVQLVPVLITGSVALISFTLAGWLTATHS